MWQSRAIDTDELVTLDLFSGAGGLSLGFQQAGFFVAAGLDAEPRCAETFSGNFAAKSVATDLTGFTTDDVRGLIHRELGLRRVDVVIGGPPCQGFAAVGQAKLRSLSDDQQQRLAQRNHLYREFVQFVETLQPLCFVMENVQHLASFQNGEIAELIRSDFDRLGYDIGTVDAPGVPLLLDAEDFGVPQTRRRMFFIGFRRGRTAPVAAPRPTHLGDLVRTRTRYPSLQARLPLSVPSFRNRLPAYFLPPPRTLADAISDLPQLSAPALKHVLDYVGELREDLTARGALCDTTYHQLMRGDMDAAGASVIYDHVVRAVREDDREAFAFMPEGGTYHDVPEEYRRYKFGHDLFEDRYFRLPWDQPSRAITAHIAKDGYWYIHPDTHQGRTLSVREAARVQSFPDHFRFAGHRTAMYRQIGNAVPPMLAFAIAERVRESIQRGNGTIWSPRLLAKQPELPLLVTAGDSESAVAQIG